MFAIASWIIDKLVFGYVISTLIFLGLRFFSTTARNRTDGYLNKANLVISLILLVHLVLLMWDTINCLGASSLNIEHSSDAPHRSYRLCMSRFSLTLIFFIALLSMFFQKRFRTSIVFTIISMMLLVAAFGFERLVIFITGLYRDYIPTSWSSYGNYYFSNYLWLIVFPIVYFLFCWINLKKRE